MRTERLYELIEEVIELVNTNNEEALDNFESDYIWEHQDKYDEIKHKQYMKNTNPKISNNVRLVGLFNLVSKLNPKSINDTFKIYRGGKTEVGSYSIYKCVAECYRRPNYGSFNNTYGVEKEYPLWTKEISIKDVDMYFSNCEYEIILK